jgi:hypothetical protein
VWQSTHRTRRVTATGDDNGLAVTVRGLEDELGEDAVRLSHVPVLGDPGEELSALVGGDIDGAQAQDHRASLRSGSPPQPTPHRLEVQPWLQ